MSYEAIAILTPWHIASLLLPQRNDIKRLRKYIVDVTDDLLRLNDSSEYTIDDLRNSTEVRNLIDSRLRYMSFFSDIVYGADGKIYLVYHSKREREPMDLYISYRYDIDSYTLIENILRLAGLSPDGIEITLKDHYAILE